MTQQGRPQPYNTPELRAAYEILRTHIKSIIAPPMCIAPGCNEPHPCTPVRDAEAMLGTAKGTPG